MTKMIKRICFIIGLLGFAIIFVALTGSKDVSAADSNTVSSTVVTDKSVPTASAPSADCSSSNPVLRRPTACPILQKHQGRTIDPLAICMKHAPDYAAEARLVQDNGPGRLNNKQRSHTWWKRRLPR